MRRKHIKYIPSSKFASSYKKEKESSRFLDDVIKIIGASSGITAIVAALFYIIGRNYAGGYFSAMSVPEYLLKFTIGEYSSVAWLPTIVLFIIFIITSISFPLLDITILPILKRVISVFIKPNLVKKNKVKEFTRDKFESISYVLYVVIITLVCYMFYQSVIIATNIGTSAGKNYLLNNANIIELQTIEPIAGDANQTIWQIGKNPQYYIYSGYRLITKNDGKYYLFKELDPETCKPKQVYIIDESKIDQVILSPAEDISDQCNAPVNP